MSLDPLPGSPPPGDGDGACWTAPCAAVPVRARIRPPGSKSMTNRALALAALSQVPALVVGPLVARDTRLMAGALGALGCRVEPAPGGWQVTGGPCGGAPGEPGARGGAGAPDPGPQAQIDVGNAGTVLRFVPPLAALTRADVEFRGDPRIEQRPVAPLLAALRRLGAVVEDGGTGRVPFVVRGRGRVRGGAVTIDASASSQLVSGLLLAAPAFDEGAEVRHCGPPVPSAPHIEMTVRMLRACGVRVDAGQAWRVLPGPVRAARIVIEPDLSNAVPFLAAAMATGGQVTVAGWPADSMQPARQIIALLTAMGARVSHSPDGLVVTGPGRIAGITAHLGEVGELTPVLTALAALASSPSEFTGIGHLRRHESDRLAALAGEIGKLGGDVTELADGLRVRPRPLRADGAVFDSHDDHRLVMAAAVLGLVTPGLRVRNAAAVAKTFPDFSQAWTRALVPAG